VGRQAAGLKAYALSMSVQMQYEWEEMSEARQYGELIFSAETAESLKRKSLQDYDSTFNYYGFLVSTIHTERRKDNYDDNNVVLGGRQRNEFIDMKKG
jgi:hypothetical protein